MTSGFGRVCAVVCAAAICLLPLARARDSAVADPAPAGLPATAAERLVESVGVNTHFNYPRTAYTDHLEAVEAALFASGIRHVRDGIPNYSRPQVLADLGRHGISHSLGFPPGVTEGQITAALRADAPYVDHVEPENELDLDRSHPNWVPEWRAEQHLLYESVHRAGDASAVTVVGPAPGHFDDAAALGAIDDDENAGAMHYYPCAESPGVTDTALSLPVLMRIVRSVHETKPIWTTEVGYEDDLPNRCALPDAVIARYVPRLVVDHWLAGMPRTYFYQFADMPSRRGYDAMGLLDTDGKPKPQYRALASMLEFLADPGPAVATATLDATIHTYDAALRRLVLQKRDGTFVILLWRDVPGWNAVTRTAVDSSPTTVELDFARRPRSLSRHQYTRSWSLAETRIPSARVIRLQVSDAVSFVAVRF